VKVDDLIASGMTAADLAKLPRMDIEAGSFNPLLVFQGLPDDPPLQDVVDRLQAMVTILNGAAPLRRESTRIAAIQRLGQLGVRSPARLVDAALAEAPIAKDDAPGAAVTLDDPEPWPQPVPTDQILDILADLLRRLMILPSYTAEAIALWIAFAHVHVVASISPMLVFASPVRRCGKTRLMSIVGALVPRRLATSNITASALYRTIERFRPTLLIDEADAFIGDKEELRGVLDAGHTRALAVVVRTVGDDYEARSFSVWCPKVLALIGTLHPTLEDRAIVIRMRRRGPEDRVPRLRLDRLDAEFSTFRRKLARWAADNAGALELADPSIPEGLHDRAADNWRPLLATAHLAGDRCPQRAREAAKHLSSSEDAAEEAASVELLADLRSLFDERGAEQIFTDDIQAALLKLDDRPWREWRQGRSLTPRGLARLLAPFGVKPRQIRNGAETRKGYRRSDLEDSFSRYLASYPKQPKQPLRDAALSSPPDTTQLLHVSDVFEDINPSPTANVSDVSLSMTPRPEVCWTCRGTRFWRSTANQVRCIECHPPADSSLVAELFETGGLQ